MTRDTAFIGDLLIDVIVDYTRHSDGLIEIDRIYSEKDICDSCEIPIDAFGDLQRHYILEGCEIDAEEKKK